MQNAVIYARFSSDRQTEASIDAQVRACKEYAAAHGLKIIGVYADEAISGKGSKTASRKQYQKMLREAEKGLFHTILIHKYDRIARNLGEHVNLEKRLSDMGVALIATAQDFGTSNESKIIRTLMWSLSEYYIDNLADETKKGHRETALKGLHNGGYPPFGYDVVNQKYVVNEFEAVYVRKMFQAALNRTGFTELLQEMEERGIKGKRGKPIKYTQIYEILRNEKYTGVYTYSEHEEKKRAARRSKPHAIRIEHAFPAIIDKSTFEEVQKIMDERKQTGKKANYLCSGLVYCSCGAKMHAAKSERKGHTYYYFSCSKRCGNPAIRMEKVDKAVLSYLHDILSSKNQLKIADALRNYKEGKGQRIEDFKAIIRRKIAEKESQHEALLSNLSTGMLPPSVVADVGERMKELKEEIEQLKHTEPPADYTVEQITSWLESLKNNTDEKAVHLLVERIDIKNKTEIYAKSTLESVLCENGCGSSQHSLPEILFHYCYRE